MPKRKETRDKKQDTSRKKYIKNFLIAFAASLIVFVIASFLKPNPQWVELPQRVSKDGVLDVTLKAQESQVSIGGQEATASMVYNDQYIGDTWIVKGGDTIKVHLENKLDQPTNLHFHGSHVSPKGNSDNVLLKINPGENFDYEYKLPENHPPGLYWYHPHMHGYTDNQVNGGMAGAIIVRGDVDELPELKGVPEKQLVLTTHDPDNSNAVVRLVNNQKNPTLYLRPFETVRLEFFNVASDDFYNLAIPGTKLNVISRDGNIMSEVDPVDSELMAPGDRVQVLFQAGAWGEIDVKSLVYDQGFFTFPEDAFMKIKVAGFPTLPKKMPSKLRPYDDFRNAKIDKIRTLTFSEGGTSENTTFLLDGKQFNPNVVDQVMELGTTEEWHLVNKSGETHPFHIHVNPYQVISVNGIEIDRKGYDDTFSVPAESTVVIRTKYTDFDGKYVLHCHILFHEDGGMMQVVEVVPPGGSPAADNGLPEREGMGDMDHGNMMPVRKRFQNPESLIQDETIKMTDHSKMSR